MPANILSLSPEVLDLISDYLTSGQSGYVRETCRTLSSVGFNSLRRRIEPRKLVWPKHYPGETAVDCLDELTTESPRISRLIHELTIYPLYGSMQRTNNLLHAVNLPCLVKLELGNLIMTPRSLQTVMRRHRKIETLRITGVALHVDDHLHRDEICRVRLWCAVFRDIRVYLRRLDKIEMWALTWHVDGDDEDDQNEGDEDERYLQLPSDARFETRADGEWLSLMSANYGGLRGKGTRAIERGLRAFSAAALEEVGDDADYSGVEAVV